MQNANSQTRMNEVFTRILDRPIAVIVLCIALIAAFGIGVPRVVKDPSVDAFVASDHPVALTRDQAKEVFGLEDPIILGLTSPRNETIFTPEGLGALRAIERDIRQLPDVQKSKLVSVLHESVISGNQGDLNVDPILEPGAITAETARLAHKRLLDMPMMVGLLGSRTGDTVTLIIPVDDPNSATATYAEINRLAREAVAELDGIEAHVAGVAAMNGRLASMVDTDTKRLIPLAILTALIIIFVALRQIKGVVGPLLIIAGSAAIAIGTMGWMGSKYYLITTALPVIVMAISIADSLHISIVYMRERELDASLSAKDALLKSLSHVAMPVTLTSITTIAGFTGLAFGTSMVPISEFGAYAAVGVLGAWLLSLTLLPAVILLFDLKPNTQGRIPKPKILDRWLSQISVAAFERPGRYAAGLVILVCTFAVFAAHAKFDYERKLYFQDADSVRLADIELNERLSGLNFLDVVVSADEEGGLLTGDALQDLAALQASLEKLPNVTQVSGVVDYIALMHEALGNPAGTLPTKPNAGAQYMFLYESSGDPGDFQEEIDYTYTQTRIRAQLKTDRYSALSPTIDAAQDVLRDWQASSGLSAKISGRVAVNDSWMDALANSHFRGLGLAILLVSIASLICFRSVLPALLTLVPVLTGVLFTYAIMGALGIMIAPATSMTAAIATGLGVDFAIHLISEMRRAEEIGKTGKRALLGRYTVVARACVYSALALGIGLAVICISTAPPLRWFGGLVSTAAIGSLVGAVFILPALAALIERAQFQPSHNKEILS